MKEKIHIPVSYCHKCRKKQPVVIKKFAHKKKKISIEMIYCAICEFVLNLDKDCKIDYVDEAWMKKRGWKLEKEK